MAVVRYLAAVVFTLMGLAAMVSSPGRRRAATASLNVMEDEDPADMSKGEAEVAVLLSEASLTFTCPDMTYAYCARSSCTTHVGESVASCACVEMRETDAYHISSGWAMGKYFQRSPGYIEKLDAHRSGDLDDAKLEEWICDEIRSKRMFPDLDYDVLSLPSEDKNAHDLTRVACTGGMTIVTCDGAPCWHDEHAFGAANYTCLCGIHPFTAPNFTVAITPEDVDHFSCDAYAPSDDETKCAVNFDRVSDDPLSGSLGGDSTLLWANAIVDAWSTAKRTTGGKYCRSWFGVV